MPHDPVPLDCEHPGCQTATKVDAAHVANLTASGYICNNHPNRVRSCHACGATGTGCAALTLNGGRHCCTACPGDHGRTV